jgi:hypothetical protein
VSTRQDKTCSPNLPQRGDLVDADVVAAADGDDDGLAQGNVVAAVDLGEEMVHRLQIERNAEVLPEPVVRAPVQRRGHLVRRPVARRHHRLKAVLVDVRNLRENVVQHPVAQPRPQRKEERLQGKVRRRLHEM